MNALRPFDTNIHLLSKVLDLRAENQKIIGSNIANAETPGYAPARFNFEQELNQAITRTGMPLATSHPGHIALGTTDIVAVTGTITREPDTTGIGDENGVSVDDEMLALSENELLYETAAQLLKKKLSVMKFVIAGGE
ncbi:MAG: flagellar basal body rod protein FlgB [Desulfoprunum sp.]|nr:flagellar basal body rod protein FlgB [Desulfoprunum sp.]